MNQLLPIGSQSRLFFKTLNAENPRPGEEVAAHIRGLETQSFKLPDLVNVADSLETYIRCLPKENRPNLSQAINEGTLKQRLTRFSGKDIPVADTIAVLSFLSRFPDGVKLDVFKSFHDKILDTQDNLTPTEIARALKAFSRMAILPDVAFMDKMQRQWNRTQEDASLFDGLSFYQSVAMLAHPLEKETISTFRNHLLKWESDAPHHRYAFMLWVGCNLDALHRKTNLHLLLKSKYAEHGINNIALANSVSLWLGAEIPEPDLRGRNRRSNDEIRLKEFFAKAAGCHICPPHERLLPGIQAPVDNRVRFAARDIIVEYDGPTHFNSDFAGNKYYNGKTVYNSKLKRKATGRTDTVVLHVDGRALNFFQNALSPSEQGEYAHAILKKAASINSASYALVDIEGRKPVLSHMAAVSRAP